MILTWDTSLVRTLELLWAAFVSLGQIHADARVVGVGILATIEHRRQRQRGRNVLVATLESEPTKLLAGRNGDARLHAAWGLQQQTQELVETLVARRLGEEPEEGQRSLHLEPVGVSDYVGKRCCVEGQH